MPRIQYVLRRLEICQWLRQKTWIDWSKWYFFCLFDWGSEVWTWCSVALRGNFGNFWWSHSWSPLLIFSPVSQAIHPSFPQLSSAPCTASWKQRPSKLGESRNRVLSSTDGGFGATEYNADFALIVTSKEASYFRPLPRSREPIIRRSLLSREPQLKF